MEKEGRKCTKHPYHREGCAGCELDAEALERQISQSLPKDAEIQCKSCYRVLTPREARNGHDCDVFSMSRKDGWNERYERWLEFTNVDISGHDRASVGHFIMNELLIAQKEICGEILQNKEWHGLRWSVDVESIELMMKRRGIN